MAYNTRSPAVKRLMKEAQELSEPTELFYAQPLEDNLFEWHFTIRGPGDTEFDGGIYHGRILLPADYPMKPPNIMVMTMNGRFEVNKKICLSISGYHPETWRPSWSIRTALLAMIGFMPTHGSGAIGSLDYPPEERKKLAKISQDFKCPQCGEIKKHLLPVTDASQRDTEEARDLAKQIDFKGEKAKQAESADATKSSEEAGATTVEATPAGAAATPQSVTGQSMPGQVPQGAPQYMWPWSFPQTAGAAPAMNVDPSTFPAPLSFTEWLEQVKGMKPRSTENQSASTTNQISAVSSSTSQSTPAIPVVANQVVPPRDASSPEATATNQEAPEQEVEEVDALRHRRPEVPAIQETPRVERQLPRDSGFEEMLLKSIIIFFCIGLGCLILRRVSNAFMGF